MLRDFYTHELRTFALPARNVQDEGSAVTAFQRERPRRRSLLVRVGVLDDDERVVLVRGDHHFVLLDLTRRKLRSLVGSSVRTTLRALDASCAWSKGMHVQSEPKGFFGVGVRGVNEGERGEGRRKGAQSWERRVVLTRRSA